MKPAPAHFNLAVVIEMRIEATRPDVCRLRLHAYISNIEGRRLRLHFDITSLVIDIIAHSVGHLRLRINFSKESKLQSEERKRCDRRRFKIQKSVLCQKPRCQAATKHMAVIATTVGELATCMG